MTAKEIAYMLLKYTDEKAASMDSAPNIGVEYMGDCGGIIVDEDGNVLGRHHSSSFGWLRRDLSGKVDKNEYEVVDLIGKEVPEKFQHLLN